jgi:hypothetical protein
MKKVVTYIEIIVRYAPLFALCSIVAGVSGFTLSSTDQRHVRELLDVLDMSVGEFIDLEEVDPSPVFAACSALCCVLTDGGAASVVPKEQEGELLTHFFGVRLWDAELESLASTSSVTSFTDRDEHFSERLMDAADVVAASAKFVLLPLQAKMEVLDALDVAMSCKGFLEARRMALAVCSRDSKMLSMKTLLPPHQQVDSITDKDGRVVEALYDCVLQQLGPQLLRPLGFPSNKLGLRSFVAATRAATNTQRAAAALGRIWHAAKEAGPLILVPNHAAAEVCAKTGNLEDYTLVVAFSALGWNGVVRPEWGGTLRDSPLVVVAHALDSCKSWFTTNPLTGAHDNGAWWDDSLADLVSPFGRVCFVGESMGGTAALRFARHASKSGTVVSFVPQIDLKDFSYSVRDDFADAHKDHLLDSIKHATQTTDARVVIHVGRNPDDLHQLTYIENVVHEHSILGLRVDAPLPRYSSHTSHAVGNSRLRVVKHDLEGHAMGAGLKAKGTLRETVLDDLLGTTSWQYSGRKVNNDVPQRMHAI